jgi:ABC-type uncharacterized transport system permease subunit
MAGLAGAHLVLFRRSNLPANVSGGIGFLALLVVLLASIRVLWVPFIAFAFSLFSSAGLPLQTRLQLDASLVGVFIGLSVFCVLIFDGARRRLLSAMERRRFLTESSPEHSSPAPVSVSEPAAGDAPQEEKRGPGSG